MRTLRSVHIVGGGLSGSETAWQVARRGVPVVLHEMRPLRSTAAHKTGQFAELVCSNSFRSDDAEASAIGLLHAEMRRLGSLVMHARPMPTSCQQAAPWLLTARALPQRSPRRWKPSRSSTFAARKFWRRPRRSGSVIIANGPLTSPARSPRPRWR